MQMQRKSSMRERIILFVAIVGLSMICAALLSAVRPQEEDSRLTARGLQATAQALDERATEIAVAATRLAPVTFPNPARTPSLPSPSSSTPAHSFTSRQSPVPLGQTRLTADGLVIRVVHVDFDAWQRVQAENQFNDSPAEGMRMLLVGVEVTNATDDTVTPRTIDDSSYRIVGDRGIVYSPFETETRCGVIPDSLDWEVFAGATVTGNVCVTVPEDEGQLQLIYKPDYGWDGQVVYFDLIP